MREEQQTYNVMQPPTYPHLQAKSITNWSPRGGAGLATLSRELAEGALNVHHTGCRSTSADSFEGPGCGSVVRRIVCPLLHVRCILTSPTNAAV